MNWFLISLMATLAALTVSGLALFLLRSLLMDWVTDRTLVRLLKEPYPKNLWSLVVGMIRVPPPLLFELEQRAETGKTLDRPLGTIRRMPDFSGIVFTPAQLVRPPLSPEEPVGLTTVIGPHARRPVSLEMPILISAMGYGIALGKPVVLALARGASRAGTAYNAGSGPVLDEVRQESEHLILQYSGGAWNRAEEVLARADMVEIRYGHGAIAATGRVYAASELPAQVRKQIGTSGEGRSMIEAPLPGGTTPAELKALVPRLRALIRGAPVGVKLAATHDLELELAAVLEAGVDVVALDGGQGGTHGAPPVLADDFGIPTSHALHRAVAFLERTGARRDVSLIISGGLRTPGEFLKALALGADAVYVGTAALMAATHGQISKAVPFEPITSITWANGSAVDRFDPEKGAQTVANFLQASAGELREAARALGKRSIQEITREDLLALDRETAETLGLPPSWRPPLPVPRKKPVLRTRLLATHRRAPVE